jgi:uncharacterized protein YndB with AHSA1/START domain
MTTKSLNSEEEIVITRTFNAPRELVFKAWTDPEWTRQWWGPKGYTAPAARIDLRVGGEYHNCMRSPEGQDTWSKGTYKEIVRPERIVCTDSFADAEGNIVPASEYGFKGYWPLEFLVTVTFEEDHGRTKFTLRHSGFPTTEVAEQSKTGWNESLDKLVTLLAKKK